MTYHNISNKEAIQSWLQDMSTIEHWAYLQEHGSWRDTNQSNQTAELASKLRENIDPQPNECYRNSFNALIHDDSGKVEYVEGLAMMSDSIDPTKHAWVEIDGSVVDLTWERESEIPSSPENSVYFGVGIDSIEVVDLSLRVDHSGPFLPEIVE